MACSASTAKSAKNDRDEIGLARVKEASTKFPAEPRDDQRRSSLHNHEKAYQRKASPIRSRVPEKVPEFHQTESLQSCRPASPPTNSSPLRVAVGGGTCDQFGPLGFSEFETLDLPFICLSRASSSLWRPPYV
jgi:hypothetical protein